jgi:hypothetical protein
MDYVVIKWLHILSSTFLFGTGIGSAWYMLFANVSRDVRAIAVVSRNVVIADWLFTATTAGGQADVRPGGTGAGNARSRMGRIHPLHGAYDAGLPDPAGR